ncbi:hypothetical protein LJ737_07205 [Hymenobacter sp. 15J16-1T3B]|uniref:hypothetical protein n=1 Tax=Hymenobacter sp. 15J16-1T3B TaxID=2886941 RepID=UPI001D1042F2|nr:hypothetical protein [Hymenobacter sp. 15J16-1T3B]MCC3157019.1 hypothetical protein [Hymenobacter sp. 15J16-1T3B]
MLRLASVVIVSSLWLLTSSCGRKEDPAPELEGRWDATRASVDHYDFYNHSTTHNDYSYQPGEQYLVFNGLQCEEHQSIQGVPPMTVFAYSRQGDTLVFTNPTISASLQKRAILEHTKTTLRLRYKIVLGTSGHSFLNEVTYTRP